MSRYEDILGTSRDLRTAIVVPALFTLFTHFFKDKTPVKDLFRNTRLRTESRRRIQRLIAEAQVKGLTREISKEIEDLSLDLHSFEIVEIEDVLHDLEIAKKKRKRLRERRRKETYEERQTRRVRNYDKWSKGESLTEDDIQPSSKRTRRTRKTGPKAPPKSSKSVKKTTQKYSDGVDLFNLSKTPDTAVRTLDQTKRSEVYLKGTPIVSPRGDSYVRRIEMALRKVSLDGSNDIEWLAYSPAAPDSLYVESADGLYEFDITSDTLRNARTVKKPTWTLQF